jgi:hypothetical protein
MDCSRVNFTFIVTFLWLEREWMVGGWATTMLSTYGYGDRHRVTADSFCVSGCSDKELNSSTSPQLHFFRSKFRAPLRCRQIVRLSVGAADGWQRTVHTDLPCRNSKTHRCRFCGVPPVAVLFVHHASLRLPAVWNLRGTVTEFRFWFRPFRISSAPSTNRSDVFLSFSQPLQANSRVAP